MFKINILWEKKFPIPGREKKGRVFIAEKLWEDGGPTEIKLFCGLPSVTKKVLDPLLNNSELTLLGKPLDFDWGRSLDFVNGYVFRSVGISDLSPSATKERVDGLFQEI